MFHPLRMLVHLVGGPEVEQGEDRHVQMDARLIATAALLQPATDAGAFEAEFQ